MSKDLTVTLATIANIVLEVPGVPATVEVHGLPDSEAREMLEGTFESNSRALQRSIDASAL